MKFPSEEVLEGAFVGFTKRSADAHQPDEAENKCELCTFADAAEKSVVLQTMVEGVAPSGPLTTAGIFLLLGMEIGRQELLTTITKRIEQRMGA